MTFPTVAGTNTSNSGGTGSPSAVVSLPASIAAGDLLIICMTLRSASASATQPAGWSTVFNDSIGTAGESGACFYKIASGSEGASVTITISSSRWAADTYRITGFDSGTPPAVSTRSLASTATPTPPALTPSWGALDTLWIVTVGHTNNGVTTAYPTNYSSNQIDNRDAADPATAAITSASRNANIATETPGSFTISASGASSAYTLAIKPAAVPNVGAVSASGAVAGVGAATAAAVGAIAASSAVAGVGKSTANSVGAVAASSAVAGVGKSTAAAVGLIAAVGGFFPVPVSPAGQISVTAAVVGVGASIARAVGAIAASSGGAGGGVALAVSTGLISASSYSVGIGNANFAGVGQISAYSSVVPVVFMEYGDTERAWVTWQSNRAAVEFENRSFRVPARTDIQERSRNNAFHVIPRLRK